MNEKEFDKYWVMFGFSSESWNQDNKSYWYDMFEKDDYMSVYVTSRGPVIHIPKIFIC